MRRARRLHRLDTHFGGERVTTIGITLVVLSFIIGGPFAAWLSLHDHEHDAVILWRCSAVVMVIGIGLALT